MTGWYRAARLEDIPRDTGLVIEVEGQEVALFRVGDVVYAMDNECPHREGPLGDGLLEGSVVTCPFHGWQVDVRTGEVLYFPEMCSRTYPCRIQGDCVHVEV